MEKKEKDHNVIVSFAKDVWNIVKIAFRLVVQFFFIFVLLFRFFFGKCQRRSRKGQVKPAKTEGKEVVVYSSDYQTKISRLKNTREAVFYEKFEPILRFFETNSASIEVEYKERIYYQPFIYMPYFRYLPKENKIEFNDTVDRSSRESKVRSLIFSYDRFVTSAKYTFQTEELVKRIPVLNVFYDYFSSISILNLFLAIAINILILIAFSSPNTDARTIADILTAITEVGWVIVSFTILILVILFIQNIPEIKDYVSRHDSKIVKLRNLSSLLLHSGILFYLAYLTTAFLGLFIHPFFFAFTLTDLINRFPTMKIIFRAVYEPRKSLILTLVLIVIMCYVFALIWYSMMARVLTITNEYFPTSIPALAPYGSQEPLPVPYSSSGFASSPDQPATVDTNEATYCCQNMLLCFICVIDNLIKNEAKIARVISGDHLQRADYPDYYIYAYDNIALILLKFLLLEIMAGLIIDTFGALRDLEISKNEDLRGSCFICGLPVEDFEKPGCADFETHIRKEHYMWNYICYLAYLKEKDKKDIDGVEQYVWQQLLMSSISWIPNGKTYFLDQDTDENIVFDNLESLESNCKNIETSLHRMKQIMRNIEQVKIDTDKGR